MKTRWSFHTGSTLCCPSRSALRTGRKRPEADGAETRRLRQDRPILNQTANSQFVSKQAFTPVPTVMAETLALPVPLRMVSEHATAAHLALIAVVNRASSPLLVYVLHKRLGHAGRWSIADLV